MKYIYIEFVRQVRPNQGYEDFDFFLLGSFDAMKLGLMDNIRDLKRKFERGQTDLPALFERQPLFLYSKDDISDIYAEGSVFSRLDGESDQYSACPMVITLFQLEKKLLGRDTSMRTPDELIRAFDQLIASEMKKTGLDKTDKIRFQSFWNLGESDIVTVFRAKTLADLAGLLQSLVESNRKVYDAIRIVSASSHCAFPNPVKGSVSKSDDGSSVKMRDRIQQKLQVWIGREFQTKKSLFVTLKNVSAYNYNPVPPASFTFGEWDYLSCYRSDEKEQFVKSLANTFLSLVTQDNPGQAMAFNTIPVIKGLEVKDIRSVSKNIRSVSSKSENPEWIHGLQVSMEDLKSEMLRIFSNYGFSVNDSQTDSGGGSGVSLQNGSESGSYVQVLADTLESYTYSVIGICKFLYRLKEGRFEDDLYSYLKPVFVSLTCITENFLDIIERLEAKSDTSNLVRNIRIFVRDYILDIGMLLTNLQHFFSVMAVSPYTYMETYGSSMRSLAASDKLLNSYQGIISFLKSMFHNNKNSFDTSILLLPYRGKRSMNRQLFGQFSSDHIISCIQIDFVRMFDIKSTVFMLLHECGHTIGDHFELKFFECFTRSIVSLCLEWLGLEYYLSTPFESFVSRRIGTAGASAGFDEKGFLLFGMPDKEKGAFMQEFDQKIRKKTLVGIDHFTEYCRNSIFYIFLFYNDKDDIFYNEKSLYSLHNVEHFISDEMIHFIFALDLDRDRTDTSKDDFQSYYEQILDFIGSYIGQPYAEISNELADAVIQKGGNAREALRLKTVYADSKDFAKSLLKDAASILNQRILQGYIPRIGSIFSDIYSDIFAITVLSIKEEDYTDIIPVLLGMDIDLITHQPSLFRFFAVLTSVWDDSSKRMPEILKHISSGDSGILNTVSSIWDDFNHSSWSHYLKDYACYCAANLREAISLLSMDDSYRNALHSLKDMFHGNSERQIKSVFYFCKYLMKGR